MRFTLAKIIILFLLLSSNLRGQVDSTIYKDLKIIKSYLVSLEKTGAPPFTKYKVNGKSVSQATYDKYDRSFENMKKCKPCINKSYTTNEKLIIESVSYGDCGVGWYKEYFLNGNLKVSGQFKENDTNNWEDLYARGYCNRMDGKWIFYNKNGSPKYVELWEDGNLIKQIPDQKKSKNGKN